MNFEYLRTSHAQLAELGAYAEKYTFSYALIIYIYIKIELLKNKGM